VRLRRDGLDQPHHAWTVIVRVDDAVEAGPHLPSQASWRRIAPAPHPTNPGESIRSASQGEPRITR